MTRTHTQARVTLQTHNLQTQSHTLHQMHDLIYQTFTKPKNKIKNKYTF